MKLLSRNAHIRTIKAELAECREDLAYWKRQVEVRTHPQSRDTARHVLSIIQRKVDTRLRRLAALKRL